METLSFFAVLVRMTFFAIRNRCMIFRSLHTSKLVALFASGAVGIIPTDTIYGISCSALDRAAVERVYTIRGRARTKPFIILISSLDTLALFSIRISQHTSQMLETIWPAPVSIIFPCPSKKFTYLHRGTKSLAFRMPDNARFCALLKKTGPLITTSANPEGKKPAATIAQAKKYFGNRLDFYVDAGRKHGAPSTILRLTKNGHEILRRG